LINWRVVVKQLLFQPRSSRSVMGRTRNETEVAVYCGVFHCLCWRTEEGCGIPYDDRSQDVRDTRQASLLPLAVCLWLVETKEMRWFRFPAYTGVPRVKVTPSGVFLMLNYTDITQNTYIQSW